MKLILPLLFLISSSLFSQTKTIAFGAVSDDYVYDFTTINNQTIFIGEFGLNNDTTLTIADSNYTLNPCFQHIISINASNYYRNSLCFFDTSGYRAQIYDAKIVYDSITNSIYLAGIFVDNIIIGNDTLDYLGYPTIPTLFLSRLDTNLNPIWAKVTDCKNGSNRKETELGALTLDEKGRPWVSIKVSGNNKITCFNGDTIYQEGRIYADSNGTITVSKTHYIPSGTPINPGDYRHFMQAIDSSRIVELYRSKLQMIDSDADTIIWRKHINTNDPIQMCVDPIHQKIYFTSISGTLYQYNYKGTINWQTNNVQYGSAEGLAINKGGDKIYLYGNYNHFKRIHMLDTNGNLLQSLTWGIDTYQNNSDIVEPKAFKISKNYLNILIRSYSDELIFGNDTLQPKMNYRYDGYFSKIDINSVLTHTQSFQNNPIQFLIFPNPTKDGAFNIVISDEILEIDCYDINGKSIKLKQIENNKYQFENSVKRGFYSLKVKTPNGVAFSKIIY